MARVLLIDDCRTVIAALKAMLTRAKYEVLTCESFTEIPMVLTRYAPEAVVLDLNMPGVTGQHVGGLLKRAKYAGAIIIYSGEARARMEAAALEIGAVECISKDAPPLDLLGAVQRATTPAPRDVGGRRQTPRDAPANLPGPPSSSPRLPTLLERLQTPPTRKLP